MSVSPEHSIPIAALDWMLSPPSKEVYPSQQKSLVFLFLAFLWGQHFISAFVVLFLCLFFFSFPHTLKY